MRNSKVENRKFLNRNTREQLRNLSDESRFHGVKVAPDRSFKERQKYRQLRKEMDIRNAGLMYSGIFYKKWIIRSMGLVKVEVKPNEA